MYMNNDIYYAAEDEKRQKISWVKTVDGQGQGTVYTAPDSPYREKNPPAQLVRKMDCIDCHNRPTHRFPAPYKLINEAMFSEQLDPQLPSIKQKALEVLSASYASQDEAVDAIRRDLRNFYQKKFADTYAAQAVHVEKNIEAIVSIYKNYFFPEMKARWDSFPDNIGHLISRGASVAMTASIRALKGRRFRGIAGAVMRLSSKARRDRLKKARMGLSSAIPSTSRRCGRK